MRIKKHIEIDSMHFLPNHKGKCSRPHGHTYFIDIEIEGEIIKIDGDSSQGMVADYGDISDIVKKYDHQNLNEIFPEKYLPTTAENFTNLLLEEIKTLTDKQDNVYYIWVSVSETRSSSATAEIIP